MRLSLVPLSLFLLLVLPVQADIWYSIHPEPQGVTLNDLAGVDDDEAWAVGDRGTVVHLHDGNYSIHAVPTWPSDQGGWIARASRNWPDNSVPRRSAIETRLGWEEPSQPTGIVSGFCPNT